MTVELQAELFSFSNNELTKQEGMVYQIWHDGEITLQKSGSLYGQRNVHCIVPPIYDPYTKINVILPQRQNNNSSYMSLEQKNLVRARELICKLARFPFEQDNYRYTIPGWPIDGSR